jgi:hypothetical protein
MVLRGRRQDDVQGFEVKSLCHGKGRWGVESHAENITVYWRIRQRALSLKGPPRVRSDDNDVLPFRLGARRATRCPIVWLLRALKQLTA